MASGTTPSLHDDNRSCDQVVSDRLLTQATTLNFEATDRIDEIRTSDVRRPTPSYYHVVCAHAFTGGREIYTTWTKAVNYATGWIPTAAGNCLKSCRAPKTLQE